MAPDDTPDAPGDNGGGASDTGPDQDLSTGEAGTVASHPSRATQAFLVAPTTAAAFNTLGLDLVPVACLSLPDVLFDFDSSFPHADAAHLLEQLSGLREKHKNAKGQLPPMSVFGHADPVGQDEYNKQLSGRRARAIYGLLTHDLKIWNALFDEEWDSKGVLPGVRKILGAPASSPKDQVFQDFMNQVFPTPLAKSEFLAGGADPKGIGDVQGCSDFNPLVVLSTSENQKFAKVERDEKNKTDRRVVVFVFRPGPKVNPAKWPCPAATEGTDKCRKQFFVGPPAGDDRRKVGPAHKEFSATKDTFACRFYDRIARLSPCEDTALSLVELRLEWPVHLVDRLPDDFTLILSGPQIPRQERNKSAASRDGDLVRFEFEWEDKTKAVQLEATGNGRTVLLWGEQVAGNLKAQLEWDERLHPLLGEHEEVEVAGEPTGAGTVPADLRSAELAALLKGLR